jgi:hypothetical protein
MSQMRAEMGTMRVENTRRAVDASRKHEIEAEGMQRQNTPEAVEKRVGGGRRAAFCGQGG